MRFLLPLCLAVLLPLAAIAQPEQPPREQPDEKTATAEAPAQPQEPQAQQQQPFGGALLITVQTAAPDFFFLSPPDFPPQVLTTDKIYKEQHVTVFPIFGGMERNAEGEAHVTYDITAFEHDGKQHFELKDSLGLKAPLQSTAGVFMPEGFIGFVATGDDPLGKYTFKVTLRDNISGQTHELEQTLIVVPYEPVPLPEDFDAQRWMTHYYSSPKPQYALDAFGELLKDVPEAKFEQVLAPLMGFYNRLLSDNVWLLPSFAERMNRFFAEPAPNERIDNALMLVLAYHLRNTRDNPGTFSPTVWNSLKELGSQDWALIDPGTEGPITMPGQLDYLWGEFFASGAYLPIWRLAGALAPTPLEQLPEVVRNLPEERRKALGDAIQEAAAWSLKSNARQHRLVLAYVIGTLRAAENSRLPRSAIDLLGVNFNANPTAAKQQAVSNTEQTAGGTEQ